MGSGEKERERTTPHQRPVVRNVVWTVQWQSNDSAIAEGCDYENTHTFSSNVEAGRGGVVGKHTLKRVCAGLYHYGKLDIVCLDEPEWKGSGYYGWWMVRHAHYDYSDPVPTYREAKQIAHDWLEKED